MPMRIVGHQAVVHTRVVLSSETVCFGLKTVMVWCRVYVSPSSSPCTKTTDLSQKRLNVNACVFCNNRTKNEIRAIIIL